MKILHTADWHLGRSLGGFSLLEEQRHSIQQILTELSGNTYDVLIIAGDIFDRPVPPVDALSLFDEVLQTVAEIENLHTIIIPGNHDQAERLKFGSSFLKKSGIHVISDLNEVFKPITLADSNGFEVQFFACPFIECSRARAVWDNPEIKTQEDAYGFLSKEIAKKHPNTNNVIIAHAFVEGAATSDSERVLTIGGSESVSANQFSSFSYTALGHLHRPQKISKDHIRYSGSIYPYSFSEENHEKVFLRVEIDDEGLRVEEKKLNLLRRLRTVKGTLEEIINASIDDENKEDFIRIELQDKGLVLDVFQKVANIYPRTIEITRPAFRKTSQMESQIADRHKATMAEHFDSFFQHVRGEQMPTEEHALLTEIISELNGYEN